MIYVIVKCAPNSLSLKNIYVHWQAPDFICGIILIKNFHYVIFLRMIRNIFHFQSRKNSLQLDKMFRCASWLRAYHRALVRGGQGARPLSTMYDFHDSTDTLKLWTDKWAINKTSLLKHVEIVVHIASLESWKSYIVLRGPLPPLTRALW